MEALLSLSFDNLSSYSNDKIRKGLRQVEGLLAQLCLSKNAVSASEFRRGHNRGQSTPMATPQPTNNKALAELPNDPAFREFFKLQEGFEWNVALRLVNCLDKLMGKSNDGQNDLLILRALDLIQGVLMLHPPSKRMFEREVYMNVRPSNLLSHFLLPISISNTPYTDMSFATIQHLLDLLEPINCPAIQSATLLTLVTALLNAPANTRVFENLDGLLTITSLFKSRSTTREVKLKLVEFLYFYLMPETPSLPSARRKGSGDSNYSENDAVGVLNRSPNKLAGAFGSDGRKRADSLDLSSNTRSCEEKQVMLGEYLGNVDDLVADLRESAPFGGVFG